MRFNVGIVLLLSLCSLLAADVSMHFEQDGLSIDRQLIVQPIGGVDTTTGAYRTRYSSTITIIITNPGPGDRFNIITSEDLSYLPPYVRLSFSEKPTTDGRTARWNLSSLAAGRSASYSILLNALVPDASISSAQPPSVTSDKPTAQLTAPAIVDVGQNVVILLRSSSGIPITGAHINAIGPDSHPIAMVSDSSGHASFTATQSGFYTYNVDAYSIGFKPTTEVRQAPVSIPSTAGAVVPVSNNTASSSHPFELSGLWPVAGALLMIGIVAFGLYVYFNRPADDDTPLPPAPATRPMNSDAPKTDDTSKQYEPSFGRSFKSSKDEGVSKTAASAPASGAAAPVESTTIIQSGSSAGSAAVATTPASLEGASEVRAQTRNLIAQRRGAGGAVLGVKPSSSPSSIDWDARPSFSEETIATDTDSDSDTGASGEASEVEAESSDSDAFFSSHSTDRQIPSWMTANPADGETSEVDDEAISKTISELEALREQLRTRASNRSGGKSIDKPKPLPEDEEAEVDAILSAEPTENAQESEAAEEVELSALVPPEEEQIEQVAEAIDTEVIDTGNEQIAEPAQPSLFTPTPMPAPEHPFARKKVARKTKHVRKLARGRARAKPSKRRVRVNKRKARAKKAHSKKSRKKGRR